ncbi:MAG: tetratricopeptide repeat protein, partial [Myxococcota bacterium]
RSKLSDDRLFASTASQNFRLASERCESSRLDASLSPQKRLDTLEQLVFTLLDEDPERARRIALNAYELIPAGQLRTKAKFIRMIGVTHHIQSDLSSALSMYEQSVVACGSDVPCRGPGFRHLAIVQVGLGDYLSALELLSRAEQACRDSVDRMCVKTRVRLIENEAHIYRILGNYNEALALARRAAEASRANGIKVSRPLMEITAALRSLGRWDEALEAAQRAMDAGREENRRSIVAYAHVAKGNIYNEIDRPAEAVEIFKTAQEIFKELSKERGLFAVESGLSRSLMLLGDLEGAKAHLQRAFDIFEHAELRPEHIDIANRIKLEIEILEGKSKAALGSLRQRDEFMRRSYKKKLSGTVTQARTEFKAVQQEREVERLKQVDALKSLRLEQQRSLLFGAAGLMGAMVLLAVALGVSLRRVRQFNRRLADQKAALADLAGQLNSRVEERECLLREINHRVNGNLQIIASLVRGQASQLRDVSQPEISYQQLLRDLQSRIEAISLVHRELYAGEMLASVSLRDLIDRICEQLSVIFGYGGHLSVCADGADPDICLDVDTAVPAALIGCELVSNAMEHAFGARGPAAARDQKIQVRMWRTSDAGSSIHLEVIDNGQGIVDPKKGQGPGAYGLRLVEQLTRQLGGQFSLNAVTEVNQGVVARVSFPVGVREAA